MPGPGVAGTGTAPMINGDADRAREVTMATPARFSGRKPPTGPAASLAWTPNDLISGNGWNDSRWTNRRPRILSPRGWRMRTVGAAPSRAASPRSTSASPSCASRRAILARRATRWTRRGICTSSTRGAIGRPSAARRCGSRCITARRKAASRRTGNSAAGTRGPWRATAGTSANLPPISGRRRTVRPDSVLVSSASTGPAPGSCRNRAAGPRR